MIPVRWNRRRVLAALGGLPASLTLPPLTAFAAPSPAGPPTARKQIAKDVLWGEEIVDPYRWMENPKDGEWEPFMKGQAAYARRVLDSIPGRKALYERVTRLSGGVPIARVPHVAKTGRLFYEMRPTGANQFKLYMRDGINATEKGVVRISVCEAGMRLVHGGGRRLRRTTAAVGKSVVHVTRRSA